MRVRRLLFLATSCWFAGLLPTFAAGVPVVQANRMVEITWVSTKDYDDPFNTVDLDCIFSGPDGRELRVPAFWAGERTWRARFASPRLGQHSYRTECSDPENPALHNVQGQVQVVAYRGENPLYLHGPLKVSTNRRNFEHADGTPFLWFGDTWWMGLTRRLKWPDEFETLAADRKQKGFNVVQIIAGLYPDMPAFDERGRGDDGFPWKQDYSRIRPQYFDAADRRLLYLVDQGFVPCIVGAWGYHLPWMSTEGLKRHWRYLVARYGALPVVWCVAGEAAMPYYLSKSPAQDASLQRRGWTQVTAYLRELDPYHRLITIHPTGGNRSRNMVQRASLLDFEMLQGGHGDRDSVPGIIQQVRESRDINPPMPVVTAEVCYEGILGKCHADVQRLIIWSCLLSGEAGHTYGANGIWQLNRRDQEYGKSPHGGNWGTTPWDEAMKLPGSAQAGIAINLLRSLPFDRFEPHKDWAAYERPAADPFDAPYAAGCDDVRVVYVPKPVPIVVHGLDRRANYTAAYFDPITGKRTKIGQVEVARSGNWNCDPPKGAKADWVVVMTTTDAARRKDAVSGRLKHVVASDSRAFALHPKNPKYFVFRGKPLALIAATEHYGSVVNRAFDFERYLDNAADNRQTMTRTFLLFRELQSPRNPSSPVKPESPEYLAPYTRVGPGTALDGEPLYDLDQWNEEYFTRLHRFLDAASKRGIVVELTLFSNTYGDPIWELNPLNAKNNLQQIGKVAWQDYTSLKDSSLVGRQRAYVRKIIQETCRYENVYYEICNEPGGGFEHHASVQHVDAWQVAIARTVREELDRQDSDRLIFGSQAFSYVPQFKQELDATFRRPTFDVANVHPLPNTVLGEWTYQLGNFMSKELALGELNEFCKATQIYGKPCVLDEDNAASLYRDETGWTIHRKRAWIALLNQNHYDYIDFSITVGSPAGTLQSRQKIRAWIKHLSEFFHSFDFVNAELQPKLFEEKPRHTVAAALGREGEDYIVYLADRREVTNPVAGESIEGAIALTLPEGSYEARLFSPTTGVYSPPTVVFGGKLAAQLELPTFQHDIALRIKRQRERATAGK